MPANQVPWFVSAIASSALITWVFGRLLKLSSFQDHPNDRSLHQVTTPKIGGFAIFVSVVSLSLIHLTWDVAAPDRDDGAANTMLRFWLLMSTLVFVVCVANDRARRDLPPLLRMCLFSLACAVFVWKLSIEFPRTLIHFESLEAEIKNWISPKWPVLIFAVVSILAFTNFFNFMDGIDGLAGSMGVIGFSCMGAIAQSSNPALGYTTSSACFTIAAASMGFLFFNWPKASVFMGDTGSTFLGFSAMTIGWLGSAQGLWHWTIPFIIFFPFWFDASSTLVFRIIQRKKIWQAHREHIYQRAILSLGKDSRRHPHLRVLLPGIALMLISSSVALYVSLGSFRATPLSICLAILVLALIHTVIAWAVHRHQNAMFDSLESK